ncbi:MAG: SLBB domain-containing protein [Pseudomonadota bacterium]
MAPWMSEDVAVQDIGAAPLSLDDLDGPLEKAKRSALEKAYSDRIVDELSQFGYDLFGEDTQTNAQPTGTVSDDYVLSAGDTLDIVLRGQQSMRTSVEIDSKGLLILDNFPPVPATARSLGDVRADLESEAADMHNTQIFVSLSGIRQIGVLVVGHVTEPGRKTLTAFHTILDALSESGGIDKTGSLRRIKLIRNGKSYGIDLYHLLMKNGGRADMLLQDGDRIVVPPIGPTVAVSGFVKRPGIYEIRDGEMLSLKDMLGLGGDVISPGKNRFLKLDYAPDGEETVQDIKDRKLRAFKDGSILMISQAKGTRDNAVMLSGHTREPGARDIKKAETLSDLITDSKVLGDDIYPLIGIIERRDPQQLTKTLIPFSPVQVLNKSYERKLAGEDKVLLFSNSQIRALYEAKENKLLHEASLKPKADKDAITDPLVKSFLEERAAFVRGAVRVPGAYPVADGTTLDNLIAVAGGLTLEANKNNIEVTSRLQGQGYQEGGRSGTRRITVNYMNDNPADILIGAGDTIRVNQTFHRVEDQSVTLIGEVTHPGRYDLTAGDTMLSLLERAGGLSPYAFPAGSIFSRASERKREESRFEAQARDLELKLAGSLQQTDGDKKPDMTQVAAMQSLIAEMKNAKAVGRITVESDPGVLKSDPSQDILLQAGDKIYIPKRPLTVRVAGEVLSPAALQFRQNKDAHDYIREAGGTTYYADKGRAFVIYPDGSASPLHVSSWEHRAVMIPPGSTIIVPRDPKPFDFLDGAERISQILANLAISGLYIEAIGDDD